MLRSTLAMFEPKLDAVMRASRSMGERVRHMSEQEELLLRNVALTWAEGLPSNPRPRGRLWRRVLGAAILGAALVGAALLGAALVGACS
eukprot:3896775-Prymnesium_polylepis.1